MARCPNCGADNPEYAFFCGKCSADLRDSAGRIIEASAEQKESWDRTDGRGRTGERGQGPSVVAGPRLPQCKWCGRQVSPSTQYCPFCGKNLRGSMDSTYGRDRTEPTEELYPSHSSGTLVLGGVMSLLAGVLAVVQGILLSTANWTASYYDTVSGYGPVCFCGGIDALFGLGAIFGGLFAFRRSNFVLALAGAIVGMLGVGFIVGGLFGLIAIICIAISKNDFTD